MKFARFSMVIAAGSLLAAALVFLAPNATLAQSGPKKESSETVARPRKKDAPPEPELEKIPSKLGRKQELPDGLPTFRSDVNTVSVDVAVLDNKGRFLPGIPQDRFRVLEDGVPQQISNFSFGEAPMTVCIVIEFSNLHQSFWSFGWQETLTAAYGLLDTLKPEDYVAVVAYDLRPEILSDFTTDRRQTREAMRRLQMAAYSESNLYDALVDTSERMSEIEGRKAIILLASGLDTFSKLTFDKTRKALQAAAVPIYSIGLLQALREWYDARGYMGSIQRLDYLQADNQLRVFSRETGGQAFFPRFFGEYPSIFNAILQALKNQYSLGYQPTNQARDGSFRRLKVELVDPTSGAPLKITDEKNKPIKYTIIAKQGYTAPREVE
jgi:Ca-activated chloride channel family protein